MSVIADGDPAGYTMVGVPAHGTLAFNPNSGACTLTRQRRPPGLAADPRHGPGHRRVHQSRSAMARPPPPRSSPCPSSPANADVRARPRRRSASGAAGIAFRGKYALVANPGTGTVTVIDTTYQRVWSPRCRSAARSAATSRTVNRDPGYQRHVRRRCPQPYWKRRRGRSTRTPSTGERCDSWWAPQPWGIVAEPRTVRRSTSRTREATTVSVIDALLQDRGLAPSSVGTTPTGVGHQRRRSAVLYVANRGQQYGVG